VEEIDREGRDCNLAFMMDEELCGSVFGVGFLWAWEAFSIIGWEGVWWDEKTGYRIGLVSSW
jgi:hypothetical protein